MIITFPKDITQRLCGVSISPVHPPQVDKMDVFRQVLYVVPDPLERIRIDCVSEANHNLILLLDKPGLKSGIFIIANIFF